MPIKGLSEQIRIPRLGKIHLGVKKLSAKKVEYPTATDYFVCPPEVIAIYGDKPTSLPIMIPVEDEDIWASQYYRAYSNTRGLTCRGDGETCRRMIDTVTGGMANRDTEAVVWKEGRCAGRECPDYQGKKCSEKMCLQFMLPEVPGIGVWQIDTGSINSIRNINSAAAMIRGLCGRVRMIPLVLSLGKQEVVNPDDGKKKNVNVLSMTHGQSLYNLLTDSTKPIHELLAPPPVEDEAPLDVVADIPQAEQDIKDYWEEATSVAMPKPSGGTYNQSPEVTTDTLEPVGDKTKVKTLSKKSQKVLAQTALAQGYEPANVTAIIVSKFGKVKAFELTDEEAHELREILLEGKFKQALPF